MTPRRRAFAVYRSTKNPVGWLALARRLVGERAFDAEGVYAPIGEIRNTPEGWTLRIAPQLSNVARSLVVHDLLARFVGSRKAGRRWGCAIVDHWCDGGPEAERAATVALREIEGWTPRQIREARAEVRALMAQRAAEREAQRSPEERAFFADIGAGVPFEEALAKRRAHRAA